jgi:type IX secretion system PorP/SprF family membrane protein
MKKVVLSFLLSLLSPILVFSQFDAQLSQYMFHNLAFNPAAAGEGNMIQITGQHRIQWLGMPNGGQTTVFSISSPLKLGTSKQGIGLKFLNDNVGQFTNQSAYFQYAFKKQLGSGVLSIGTDLGFISIGFHGDSVHTIPIGDYQDNSSDLQIPKSSVVGISFDMSLGLYYSSPKLYAGISYMHLNNPVVNWGDNLKFKQTGSMYFTSGYSWELPDKKFVFKPSTLIKTDFSTFQCDLTARLEYDAKYWGGLTYRIQDALVVLVGINIASGLSIGYSYDLPTSHILMASSGSHEILVMYNFEYIFGKRNSNYKSIRIL